MLTSIRIQNFRSIRDASVKLGQVNLFIGPNNSGKSNFLKGIEFTSDCLSNKDTIKADAIYKVLNKNPLISTEKDPYDISRNIEKIYIKISLFFDYKIPNIGISTSLNFSLRGELDYKSDFYPLNNDDNTWHNLSNIERAELNSDSRNAAGLFLSDTIIYKPDPVRFLRNSQVFFMERPSADLDNIIAFLFNLSQNHISLFNRLNSDFAKCVGTLSRVSTPAEKSERGFIKLRFFDKQETPYDSEEVSEGVLYFLALLCIIHQPKPPKLLLLGILSVKVQ